MADPTSDPTPASKPPANAAGGPVLILWGMLFVGIAVAAVIGMGLAGDKIAALSDARPASGEAPADLVNFQALYWSLFAGAALAGFIGMVLAESGAVRWAVYGSRTPHLVSASNDEAMLTLLASINDRMLLSDRSKRVAYREQERNALRKYIREDIDRGDFEAALVLAEEMGDTFGYREEAEQFRDEILAAREAYVQRKVNEAVAALDQMLANHQWHRALTEASKIQRLYPDSPKVHGLETYVRDSFHQYKESLGRQLEQATQRDDVELAMELLREMDKYLTESEAANYREMARKIIARKRDNLGVQFRMAVQDKEWSRALRVGDQIIADFPNTKMAEEVKSKRDDLRALAQQHAQQPAAT